MNAAAVPPSSPPTGPIRHVLRSVFLVQEGAAPRVAIAVRAAISLGAPLALATLFGVPHLGLQAAAGAFLAIFYTGYTARERAKTLPFVMLVLCISALLGIWCVTVPWLLALGLVVVAVGGAALVFPFMRALRDPYFL